MTSIRQAVILAGGLGTRMRPQTFTTPKPMIPIQGKPFLAYLMELLKKNGIEEVIILVGYLHKQIEEYFGDGEKFGLKITYSYDPAEADTGTRVRNASRLFAKHFLLLYGDNYWALNLSILSKFYKDKKKKASTVVFSNFDNSTKNNMRVNENAIVEIYDRERKNKNLNAVDIGFFILDRDALTLLPSRNFSFEEVVLQKLIKNRQLAGLLTHHKYYSLTNPDRIKGIETYFEKKKVVFLDRDGVINKKPPKAQYVTKWKDFLFLPKAKEALILLKKKKYKIFILSNQPGVARGMMTARQLDEIHNHLRDELGNIGVTLDGIYSCTHGWNDSCFCRKPSPGLFFEAAAEHFINLFDSYCVGDDPRDIIAGSLAGCKTIFLTSQKDELSNFGKQQPTMIAKDLYSTSQKLP